jgi:hypothetical protein
MTPAETVDSVRREENVPRRREHKATATVSAIACIEAGIYTVGRREKGIPHCRTQPPGGQP